MEQAPKKSKTKQKQNSILISACLIGQKTRYDGKIIGIDRNIIDEFENLMDLIPVCPEVEGGLPVPRCPAELSCEISQILTTKQGIVNRDGVDVTGLFLNGIAVITDRVNLESVYLAILKENSPSCGVRYIYDGSFTGRKIKGHGIFTHLLQQMKIPVFSDKELELAIQYVRTCQKG
ncbi:MAG: DUF523 domain-containing protein [Calditrichia bacterium]